MKVEKGDRVELRERYDWKMEPGEGLADVIKYRAPLKAGMRGIVEKVTFLPFFTIVHVRLDGLEDCTSGCQMEGVEGTFGFPPTELDLIEGV